MITHSPLSFHAPPKCRQDATLPPSSLIHRSQASFASKNELISSPLCSLKKAMYQLVCGNVQVLFWTFWNLPKFLWCFNSCSHRKDSFKNKYQSTYLYKFLLLTHVFKSRTVGHKPELDGVYHIQRTQKMRFPILRWKHKSHIDLVMYPHIVSQCLTT